MREVRFAEPPSVPSGRRFAPVAERELHQHVGRIAVSLPGPAGDVLVIPEMPSPLGLPDFVALIGGANWFASRQRAEVAPVLAETDCVVLSTLSPRRPLHVSSIATRLAWSPERLEPVLMRLKKSGAVHTTSTGAISLTSGLEPGGTLYAIEAKVRDWRKAMRQGRSYRTWANNYVVLLGDVGDVAIQRARDEIAKDGAGLVTGQGWIVPPKARVPASARRLLGYEYVFAALSSDPALRTSEEL